MCGLDVTILTKMAAKKRSKSRKKKNANIGTVVILGIILLVLWANSDQFGRQGIEAYNDGFILLTNNEKSINFDLINPDIIQLNLDITDERSIGTFNEPTMKWLNINWKNINGTSDDDAFRIKISDNSYIELEQMYTRTKFDYDPSTDREVWLNIDFEQFAESSIERDPTLSMPTEYIDCYLNGNQITAGSSSYRTNIEEEWGYFSYYNKDGSNTRFKDGFFMDVTDRLDDGENVITCFKKYDPAAEDLDHLRIQVAYYNYQSGNTIDTLTNDAIPQPNGVNIGHKSSYYNEPIHNIVSNVKDVGTFITGDVVTSLRYSNKATCERTVQGTTNDFTLTSFADHSPSGSHGCTSYYTPAYDLTDGKFRVNLEWTYKGHDRADTNQLIIKIGDITVYSNDKDDDQGTLIGLFETIPSVLNPEKVDVYFQGNMLETIDFTGIEEKKVTFEVKTYANMESSDTTSAARFLDPRFQPLFSCEIPLNHLLAMETFQGNQDISLYSTRYAVKSFCLAHPVIITSASSGGSTTTAEPYNIWRKGETTSIPTDQTWTVFYVMENDGSIAMTCPGEAYDVNNNKCVNTAGVVSICGQGTFDPNMGTCVVTPETQYQCPEGGYYNVESQMCVYHPPIQYICEYGTYSAVSGKCEYHPATDIICEIDTSYNVVYNQVSGKCEYRPDIAAVCESQYTFNSITDKCEYKPEGIVDCAAGYNYNSLLDVCERTPDTDTVCPQGTIYNSIRDKCEYKPDISTVCPDETTWNPGSGFCEQYPTSQIICPTFFAYDSILGKCVKRPDTSIICPDNTYYNEESGNCEYSPETDIVCTGGYQYNTYTQLCEFHPDLEILCPTGSVYNSEDQICTVSLQSEYTCELGSLIQNNGIYTCIYSPDVSTICTQGTFDASKDKCIYYPDAQGICIKGVLVGDLCEYEGDIICEQGTYNNEMDACLYRPSTEAICSEGVLETYQGDERCVVRPDSIIVCPSGYGWDNNTQLCTHEGEGVDIDPSTDKIEKKASVDDGIDFSDTNTQIVIGGIIVVLIFIYISGRRRRY